MKAGILKYQRRRPGRDAFTMLEIMLAVAIFSLIMAAIYTSWNSVIRGSQAAANAAATAQRSRVAIGALEQALASTKLYEANARFYSFETDTQSEFAYLSLAAALPPSFPGGGLFGDQVLRRVTFSVEPDEFTGMPALVMTQTPLLAYTNADLRPVPITLARDVRLFAIEFWDTRNVEWATEWLSTNQLPPMVRVSLAFGSPQAPLESLDLVSRVVLLPTRAVMRQAQLPGAAGGRADVRPGAPSTRNPASDGSSGQAVERTQRNPGLSRGGLLPRDRTPSSGSRPRP